MANRFVSIFIIAVCCCVAIYINVTAPTLKQKDIAKKPFTSVPAVQVVNPEPAKATLTLKSYGSVKSQRSITLVADVSGKIQQVSPRFLDGLYVERDANLVLIEPADYELALTKAKAKLSESESRLAQEKGRAKQAQREWRQLESREANELFLRSPQIKAAEASIQSAIADVKMAEHNLQRTRIAMPFDGRIVDRYTEIGQFVKAGDPIAKIYDHKRMEVKLPLSHKQARHLNLNLDGNSIPDPDLRVELVGNMGGREYRWKGQVHRTSGAIDKQYRSISLIVQIKAGEQAPLPGTFVTAELSKTLGKDVWRVPNSSVYSDTYLSTVKDSHVERVSVSVIEKDNHYSWVIGNLAPGCMVIVDSSQLPVVGSYVSHFTQDVALADEP